MTSPTPLMAQVAMLPSMTEQALGRMDEIKAPVELATSAAHKTTFRTPATTLGREVATRLMVAWMMLAATALRAVRTASQAGRTTPRRTILLAGRTIFATSTTFRRTAWVAGATTAEVEAGLAEGATTTSARAAFRAIKVTTVDATRRQTTIGEVKAAMEAEGTILETGTTSPPAATTLGATAIAMPRDETIPATETCRAMIGRTRRTMTGAEGKTGDWGTRKLPARLEVSTMVRFQQLVSDGVS
ncbi:hypothetical protein BJY59DRAFT_180982 [Rhodotorula toruloides]